MWAVESAPVQKEPHYVGMSLLRRNSQGGVALLVPGFHVGSRSDEALGEAELAVEDGDQEWREQLVGCALKVRSGLEENAGRLSLVVRSCREGKSKSGHCCSLFPNELEDRLCGPTVLF